ARRRPTVGRGIVSAASIQIVRLISSTPDDHFTAGPFRCVRPPRGRRIYGAGSYPTIRAWIVSSAAVEMPVGIVVPAPDDHFATGPYCDMTPARVGRVRSRSGSPSVVHAVQRNGDFGELVGGLMGRDRRARRIVGRRQRTAQRTVPTICANV